MSDCCCLSFSSEKMFDVQKLRKQRLKGTCDREAFSGGKNSLEDVSEVELDNLVVDETRGIIYCYIPKVI